MKRIMYGLMLSGISLLSACRSTSLLTATFEADAIGALPGKVLPGPPTGDSLSYKAVIHPRLRVLASTASPGQKALVLSQATLGSDATAHNQWLTFKGIRSDYTQTIWYYWTATLGPVGGNMVIDVNGIESLWVTRIKINPEGRISLVQDPGSVNGDLALGNAEPTKTPQCHYYAECHGPYLQPADCRREYGNRTGRTIKHTSFGGH